MALVKAALLLLAGMGMALPQGSPAPTESPTGLDCSWHLDHWDCAAPCSTITNTRLAIDATITDYPSWLESMNLAHSTDGVPWSGTRVFVHTFVYEYPGGSFTGYGVYDSHALTRAGYSVINEEVVTTTCPPSTTFSLPPSPTGVSCSPHQDHWHCDPVSTSGLEPSPTGECTAHGDHWHCPPGVPEPPFSPSGSVETSTSSSRTITTVSSQGECTPHGDHWHCPPNVPEPTSPPGGKIETTMASSSPTTTSSPGDRGKCTPHGDHWHCPQGIPEPTFPPGEHTTTSTGSGSKPTASTSSAGECAPHDDHWHCPSGVTEPPFHPGGSTTTSTGGNSPAPTSPPTQGEGECTPHGDHWHCPPGVAEPSYPPGREGNESVPPVNEETECEAHDDHWHCPEGVKEPPYAPGGEPGADRNSGLGTGSSSQGGSIAEPSILPITEVAGAVSPTLSQAFFLMAASVPLIFGHVL